jgi:hypothetical protein
MQRKDQGPLADQFKKDGKIQKADYFHASFQDLWGSEITACTPSIS